MRVLTVTHDKEQIWDNFALNHPDATMYHLFGWKNVFESVFGYKPFYLMAVNSMDEPEGILPMFSMMDMFRRKYLISNPFSNFAGICANCREAEESLLNKAIEIAANSGARYVELRQLNKKISSDLPTKESFVTLMLNLPSNSEFVWDSISSRNRNKIRKAEKNGLEVDFGMQFLNQFYAIYARNMKFLGTPVFPLQMFEAVAKIFADRVELLVLKKNSEPVSGMFLFKFKKVISEPWVASLRILNKIYVNNYLYWQAIKYACNQEFIVFDFGRSTVDTGTYDFKKQWGAEPVPLQYQYYLNKAREIPVVDAINNKYQKIIDIWKKLPLGLTNFVGPKVVQYLPEL